jgi:hypothetical protein
LVNPNGGGEIRGLLVFTPSFVHGSSGDARNLCKLTNRSDGFSRRIETLSDGGESNPSAQSRRAG